MTETHTSQQTNSFFSSITALCNFIYYLPPIRERTILNVLFFFRPCFIRKQSKLFSILCSTRTHHQLKFHLTLKFLEGKASTFSNESGWLTHERVRSHKSTKKQIKNIVKLITHRILARKFISTKTLNWIIREIFRISGRWASTIAEFISLLSMRLLGLTQTHSHKFSGEYPWQMNWIFYSGNRKKFVFNFVCSKRIYHLS